MFTVSHTGTLLREDFASGDLIDAAEARFLTAAVRDAVRCAQRTGRHEAQFHRYIVKAWREPLGSRLVTVTWRVTHDGQPVAGDTQILEAPPSHAA